jgi:hypothetical protein
MKIKIQKLSRNGSMNFGLIEMLVPLVFVVVMMVMMMMMMIMIIIIIYLLQFGCYPVAVVILHVNKT